MTGSKAAPALRERTRRAVRVELTAVAMGLFAEHGYEATTVDRIATAAGMSRRSFFRYFASKEEVVLWHFEELGEAITAALAARPAREDAWTALRRSFDVMVERHERDPEDARAVLSMIGAAQSLCAGHLERELRWQEQLLPHVAVRLGVEADDRSDPGARAITATAVACLREANFAWLATEGSVPLDTMVDRAMGAVKPGELP